MKKKKKKEKKRKGNMSLKIGITESTYIPIAGFQCHAIQNTSK